MPDRLQLVGKRFGSLVVMEYAGQDNRSRTTWKCKCDCGREVIVVGSYINRGRQRSCGCKRGRYKHGLTDTKLYNTYDNMVKRCYIITNPKYKDYGGRGITICEEWRDKEHGRENFMNWAFENGYSDDLTLDRIDNNGNYEPKNCRWTDYRTQVLNRRVSRSKLGIRGVYAYGKRYRANIRPNGKLIHLGTFDTIEEAKAERKAAELKYYGKVLD